jgi:hypothetical protein
MTRSLRATGESSPLLEGKRLTIVAEHLETDVIGAGLAVRVHARVHGVFVAVHDYGVTESIRSTAHEVFVTKAEAAPTVLVVQ